MRVDAAGIVALLAAWASTTAAGRQSATASVPALEESLDGPASFDRYCASCHGPSGRGDGPTAKTLRTAPADLTILARRNNGVFPAERVTASIVDATRAAAHGTPDMPIWGPLFRTVGGPDERDNTRLHNLLSFLASIQLPPGGLTALPAADPDGSSLYRNYCWSCHGPSGRGSGPFTFALRTPAPNLRTLSIRNRGVFPREATIRAIRGDGVPSHGSHDMPIYGELFRRLRPRDPGAGTRIDALVAYLEQIQEGPAQ